MTLPQNDVKAVILSGGGAHGAYEVGVLKALMSGASWTTGNVPLDPQILTGTSIGAYNAAVLLSRLEVENPAAAVQCLEDVWTSLIPSSQDGAQNRIYRFRGNPAEVFNPEAVVRHPVRTAASIGRDAAFFAQDFLRRGLNFFASTGDLAKRSLELIDLSTLISRDPSEQLLRDTIVLESIRGSSRLLFLAATDWRTGKLRMFRNQDMTDEVGLQAVLASSAIPGVFPPVTIGRDVYVDGGLSLNVPLAPAFLEANPGADTAHVIYLDPKTDDIPLQPLQSSIGTMDRLITLILSRSIDSDMRIASRVNRGLQLVSEPARTERLASGAVGDLIGSVSFLVDGIGGRLPDSPKTIHRYRPSRYLGGTLSLLNFSHDQIVALIDLGFNDVMTHDCVASECVLPDGPPIEAVQSPPP